ncbi:lipoprotein [Litoreibacter arenae]|uniref:Lipoprotein, putative n=1 Tax=Litoreibacter arenae DSM 19593 TaxID=1123360 RepID=S9QQ45_9RHOB|nr:lipoprotein [Litoreibacter arenae]EPX81772.1 lipoprotein, putative [Litoreibacter arenae DSM 19593]
MKRLLFVLGLVSLLAACGAEPVWAPDEDVRAKAYRDNGPATITLITVINNRSGAGGHTGLLINGSQRVVWDPAGTWWNPNAPERNDLHYGMTDHMVDVYVDYHTRQTYHTVLQELQVSPEVAEQAIREAASYGAVPKASCSQSTTAILRRLPGFESIKPSFSPIKTMKSFASFPGVKTRKVYDDDPDDNASKLPGGA